MNFEKLHSQLDLPFLETKNQFIKEIFQTLEAKFDLKRNSNQKFIDLGAGNGSVVIFSALNYNIKSYGIEINPNLVNEARNRIKSLKKEGIYNKRLFRREFIVLGDFYSLNLKKYDFVYIYSLPSMHIYLKHLFRTAKSGTTLISHKYQIKELNSFLKDEYRLTHKNVNPEIYTYFYKKI